MLSNNAKLKERKDVLTFPFHFQWQYSPSENSITGKYLLLKIQKDYCLKIIVSFIYS